MIYTVTFNPALDYVIHVDELTLGEVNRTDSEEFYFGGKGINVSTVLNNLDVTSIALGFVAGFTGDVIENGVMNQGIKCDFIHLDNGISRINMKIKSNNETEINGKGPDISDSDLEKLFSKLAGIKGGDVLVLAGSIPESLPDNIYEQIMERFYKQDVKVVVDATKDLLLNVLKYKPFLIKPNNFELGEMFGVKIETEDDIYVYARKLTEMGAQNVLVSMAGDGAILLDEFGQYHKIGVAKGKVVNSVGAGDSMVAGFIAGYLKHKDYYMALKLGACCGGATAFSKGLASKEKVMELLNNF